MASDETQVAHVAAQQGTTPGRRSDAAGRDASASGRQELGRWGEDLATVHLRRCGLVVLARNWRCEHGEIDIVARDGSTVVVCEVKTRRGMAFGGPLHALSRSKVSRLRRLTAAWLAAHDEHVPAVRIDLIGILRRPAGPAQLVHLTGVA